MIARGWPTLRGSKSVRRDQPWDEDAPMVARLREQGAVLLGKTTTPEFGWKAIGDSPLTGITRNPWNRERTPGGSSAGAAVAAATGMGPLHLGSDGGGSIRIPSSFTGVFGIKPTYGLVAASPPSPFAVRLARRAHDAHGGGRGADALRHRRLGSRAIPTRCRRPSATTAAGSRAA